MCLAHAARCFAPAGHRVGQRALLAAHAQRPHLGQGAAGRSVHGATASVRVRPTRSRTPLPGPPGRAEGDGRPAA
eukprot:4399347-Prymnesium_polylepis.1